jgi:hypothetical protein
MVELPEVDIYLAPSNSLKVQQRIRPCVTSAEKLPLPR